MKKPRRKENNERKYQYIIPYRQTKTTKARTTLNQFICLECYGLNLVEENIDFQTELYGEKRIPCRCCDHKTTQVCVKDKMLTKLKLELTGITTPQEEKVHQAIFKQTREIERPPKTKRKKRRRRPSKREVGKTK